jgi:hypothetical protein
LNIATRDSDESVVSEILEHDFSDPSNKPWLMKWLIDEPPGGTWENRETLKDVEAFHHYCAANKLNAFLPRYHTLWEVSMPSTQRRTAAQQKGPGTTPRHDHRTKTENQKIGRPVTKTTETTGIATSSVKQGETRVRGRPRKDRAPNDGGTTARRETEETTQRLKADEEGQEAVTTMVNYVAATIGTQWWNSANGRDKEIPLGIRSASTQPEDA